MSTDKRKQMVLQANNGNFELPHTPENWVLKADQGYSPVQLVVAAAACCGGYVYQEILENSHVSFEMLQAEVSYTRNEEKTAQPLKQIEITFHLKVADEDQRKAISCLRLIDRHCPVIQSLDPEIEVTQKAAFVD